MQLGIGHIFSILAAFQSFLIAAILIHKKNRNQSNWILAGIFFFFALQLINTMAISREIFPQLGSIHRLIYLFSNTPLIIAPLIYLMARSVFEPDYKLSGRSSLHFIPAVGFTLFFLYYWYPSTKNHLIEIFRLYQAATILMLAQNLIYLFLILLKLRAYKAKRAGVFQEIPRASLIIYIAITYVFLWIIDLGCLVLYDIYQNADYCAYSRSGYFTVGFIAFSLVLYWAFLFPESMILKNKYQFSQLNVRTLAAHEKSILNYLQKEKAYLDPELNLSKMAVQLAIPEKELSQTLNQQFQKSFKECINDFRIEEFKKILKDDEDNKHRYMADIYYAVGFNSKSAFYAAFKKATGLTPSVYQKKTKS